MSHFLVVMLACVFHFIPAGVLCSIVAPGRGGVEYFTDGVHTHGVSWKPLENSGGEGGIEVCLGPLVPRSLERNPIRCTPVSGPMSATTQDHTGDSKLWGNIDRCLQLPGDSLKADCVATVMYVGIPD